MVISCLMFSTISVTSSLTPGMVVNSARDAVSLGAKILCDHFTLFTDLSETVGSKSTVVEKAETQRDKVLELT